MTHYIYDFDNSCNDVFAEHLKVTSEEPSMRQTHYHDFYEFYFYLGDGMTYFIDNRSYGIKKYDLVFINKNIYHRTLYKTNREERILILFRENVFDVLKDSCEIMSALSAFHLSPKMTFNRKTQEKINTMMQKIVDFTSEAGDTACPVHMSIMLMDFILSVKRFTESENLLKCENSIPETEIKITDIINFILKNYNSKITLDDLSSRFFLSKYHLCRKFKRTTGQSVIDFINEKRLVQAKKLLVSSDRTVMEIALRVGFDSPNHFTALFKSKYGLTPFSYKKHTRTMKIN